MRQPKDMTVISVIDTIDKVVDDATEEKFVVEALVAVIMNFVGDSIEEMVHAMAGMASYSFVHKNLDLDMKNRENLPVKSFVEEPPVLDLKSLLAHFRYAYLGPYETLSVIISIKLLEWQAEALLSILRTYKRDIGWTIADIIGISLGIYTHKIQLEENCNPSIEHQRRLNSSVDTQF